VPSRMYFACCATPRTPRSPTCARPMPASSRHFGTTTTVSSQRQGRAWVHRGADRGEGSVGSDAFGSGACAARRISWGVRTGQRPCRSGPAGARHIAGAG
jgi:hypothetical protein